MLDSCWHHPVLRLINAEDRLNKERVVADRRARSQQLEIKLAPAIARALTLQSFNPLTADLIALAKLAPDSAVIVAARGKLRAVMEDRLAALGPAAQLAPLVAMHDDHAELLVALGLSDLSDRVSSQRDTALARVEGLTNGIENAIAWGNLDAPADNNAASQLAALRAIAPDDKRVNELQEKLINAYASRATDKIEAGAWNEARAQIALARQLQPSPTLESRLQQVLESVDAARQQAKDRLASEGEKRAAEAKQRRLADLEEQLRNDTEAAKTIDDSRQILQKLSRLEAIAPGQELVKSTRRTLATKLSSAAVEKGRRGSDWDVALKDITYVASLFPDSAAAEKARIQIESDLAKAQTLAKKNEINDLRTNLTQLAGAKPDEAWSQSVSVALAKLVKKVPADDPWLVQMRGQLSDIYVAEAAKLQSSQRFSLASQQLDRAETINPKATQINQARNSLKASLTEFRSAQRKKDITARIEAHKQTFVAHIKSKQITNAKKTLALLTKDLPSDDSFLTTEAPTMLAGVYLQFANSKIAQKDFGAAIEFAQFGLKYRPRHAQLLAAQKTAKSGLNQSTAKATIPISRAVIPSRKPIAPKPSTIVAPTPAPAMVASRITGQQVYGNWCSEKVNLTLAANSFTFILPGGAGSASYPIKQYDFAEKTFTIAWVDKQRGAMETQFGNLASDNSSLVQLRGRSLSAYKWNEYTRLFRRCP